MSHSNKINAKNRVIVNDKYIELEVATAAAEAYGQGAGDPKIHFLQLVPS